MIINKQVKLKNNKLIFLSNTNDLQDLITEKLGEDVGKVLQDIVSKKQYENEKIVKLKTLLHNSLYEISNIEDDLSEAKEIVFELS